jgi:hypothetical protein
MATYKFTGLGAGSARTDSVNLGNIQDGTGVYVGTVGGTANAITLTPSPAITAYATGQEFEFLAATANTSSVTVAVSGLTTKAITKMGSTALVGGEIKSGALIKIRYDGTQFVMSPSLFYEEGAWTPVVGGTATYSTQIGTYTRIGNTVTATCYLVINSLGTGGTAAVDGLPYNFANVGATCSPICFGLVANVVSVVGIGSTGQNDISFYSLTAAAASHSLNSLFTNGTEIDFTITYRCQ